MEQDKRVEDKKARFILLITQVVLWFMVMVMEMVVLIVKQINVLEHMLFVVSINLTTIVTILINVHNYRKNKKRMQLSRYLYYTRGKCYGMLIGIIQSEWRYREFSEETNCWDKIDILFKKGRILLGAILIIIEIVVRMLYPSMFMGLPLITRIFSYIILAVLPIEIIVFNSFLVKKQNGMAI